MTTGKILAGLDAGHVHTKALIMKGEEILGYATVPTGFDAPTAARAALGNALEAAGLPDAEPAGLVATGIFRDMIAPSLGGSGSVPDYMADARGAVFLNENSRSVIDIGANVCKAVRFDRGGRLLDVAENDKCADGLGIFYTTLAKALGFSEQELSEAAGRSSGDLSVAIQCAISAESDAIDLMSRGEDIADVADAVLRFIAERVADMCTPLSLTKEIVAAGGLARSQALIAHVAALIEREVDVLRLPEYTGAVGAVMSYEGKK